ncbi:hypothetical protein DB30_05014 [Enhygromyxa salina]|uniref:DUF2723 domain-containing protein n=1 Tax=Enhygromyxa salina TaxID=215803 RepID=A0A0C2D2F9_9BACT|nr:DUF2723 domain-containing protein [Enhygromyxa salina]KIG15960.1 hypothetical protein DB30_05014 [Enhygromyxa salina]
MGGDKAQQISTPNHDDADVDAGPEWSVVILAPLLVALALWSVPTAIQGGDAAEFATVMLDGGVPHPSGYPWMRVLGLLARGLWAIGLPPATAAALPPALCGVAGWLLIHRGCVLLGRAWIGAFVVLLAASSSLVVLHVNDSEVWGPLLFFAGLFVHTVIRTQSRPRPFPLGIMLGLTVSHHLTGVLLIPLAIGAAWPRGRDRGWLSTLRAGGLGLAGSLVGLLAYATLAIGRGGSWRWGRVETLAGFWHHVVRGDYGTFSLSLHEEQVAAGDSVARSLASVGEVLSAGLTSSAWVGGLGILVILTLAGLWTRAHADQLHPTIAVGAAASAILSAVAFPSIQNIDPSSPAGAWILERFDLLTVLLLATPASLGIAWVAEKIADKIAEKPQVRPWLPTAGGVAIGAVMLFAQVGGVLERGRPSSERAVELAAIDLVTSPDPNGPAIPSASTEPIRAIVIGTEDHRTFPVLYVQEVLGAGSHTLYIDASLLTHAWYRERLRARVPGLPDVDKPLQLIGEIWSDPELGQVPIYLANVFSRPAAELPKVPEGMLWRVPPPTWHSSFIESQWTHQQILARHLAASARMRIRPGDFSGLTHPRGHPWSADLWFVYVDTAKRLASTLARAGHEDELPAIRAALELRVGPGF